MGLADISNIPDSYEELQHWSFSHAGHHRDVQRVILERFQIALPEFALDPFNPANMGVWGAQHQIMHSNNNQILGVSGNDLIDVDWTKADERAAWIFLDANEHKQWSDILGV